MHSAYLLEKTMAFQILKLHYYYYHTSFTRRHSADLVAKTMGVNLGKKLKYTCASRAATPISWYVTSLLQGHIALSTHHILVT